MLFLKLWESARPEEPGGETVLRVIQAFESFANYARGAAHQLANTAQFLLPQ